MEEIWKDIDGYEGIYQISNLGKVKSFDRRVNNGNGSRFIKSVIKKQYSDKDGYLLITLNNIKSKRFKVHRLVAKAFIPNPENKPQVNHKNKIKSDNNVNNLEWNTCSENHKHAYRNGRVRQKGELAPNSKLTESDAKKIKYNYPDLSSRKIASKYNVSFTTVLHIKKGKMWKHI